MIYDSSERYTFLLLHQEWSADEAVYNTDFETYQGNLDEEIKTKTSRTANICRSLIGWVPKGLGVTKGYSE